MLIYNPAKGHLKIHRRLKSQDTARPLNNINFNEVSFI